MAEGPFVAEGNETMDHPPRADREERAARLRRAVAIVGNGVGVTALLVAIASAAAILWFTSHDVSIGSVIDDDPAGTMTIAFPVLMALLSMIGFFFGQFAARGRWGAAEKTTVLQSGSFQVDLRPIGVGLHSLFLGLSILAWGLVVPLLVAFEATGAVAPAAGGSAAEQFWFAVVVFGVVTGALAAVVAVSLLKKITFTRSLERGRRTIVDGSPAQVAWRRFSHIWRGELMVAAAAGAALGLSPIGIHLDSLPYGIAFGAAGAALLAVSIVLALNSWRSGLPVERVESYT